MSTTFSQKKKVETFSKKIDIAIPPENPVIKGHITVDFKVKSKTEIAELSERGLPDEEYIPEILDGVHGLGHPETDEELTGSAAVQELLTGRYSMYLVPAVVATYFEQYGEARRGNSRKRR
ncbi:MAG: hypothetical protein ACT4PG_09280 [Panacagrimonas sp.]